MLMLESKNSLRELLDTAETPDDFAALEELIAEDETKRRSEPVASRWSVRTLGEVAEFFGYAFQTVREWRSFSPPMPGEPGAWPLKEIVQWRLARVTGSELATAKKEQDLALGQVKLESERLELAKERRELLETAEVERWAATALIEAREMVMSLPEMLATSSPPGQREFIRAETERHCRDVLTALRRRLESDQIGSDAPPTAAAES